jgi:N-acetylmuramoyl-L-alanine amidase
MYKASSAPGAQPGDGASGPEAQAAGPFDAAAFDRAARAFGYPQAAPEVLLRAVRLRFRPWARGPGDALDMAIATDLARRFAIDGTGGAA